MTYFDKDFIKFFKELRKNNNRDWFNENKKRYIASVKDPYELFIGDLIVALNKVDSEFNIPAKDAIFRIYRDVRFSKNKEPYKLHAAAVISKYGRKNNSYPGVYVMLSDEKMMIGGGIYQPDKDSLYDLRESIYNNPDTVHKLINNKKFKSIYGDILGEKNKILPKEFKDKAADIPLLFNKQFYYMADLPAETILKEDLIKTCVDAYKTAKPLKEYLIKATGIK